MNEAHDMLQAALRAMGSRALISVKRTCRRAHDPLIFVNPGRLGPR
jgi:hypothetical protein